MRYLLTAFLCLAFAGTITNAQPQPAAQQKSAVEVRCDELCARCDALEARVAKLEAQLAAKAGPVSPFPLNAPQAAPVTYQQSGGCADGSCGAQPSHRFAPFGGRFRR